MQSFGADYACLSLRIEVGKQMFKEELLELNSKVEQETNTVNKGDNIENWKEKERIKCINECLDTIKRLEESMKSATTIAHVLDLHEEYSKMMNADFQKAVFNGMDEEVIKNMTKAEKEKQLYKFLEIDDQESNNNYE